jgi:hypothetical protein
MVGPADNREGKLSLSAQTFNPINRDVSWMQERTSAPIN